LSDASKGTGKSTAEDAGAPMPEKEKRRRRPSGATVKAGSNAVRSKIASVVWLVAVVCALFLAVGALLIALNANEDNSIFDFVISGADFLDGPLSRENGLFTFEGKDAATKGALVNWGIAAVIYLLIGKILDRVIRP
jgi:hypothetical protein